LVFAFENNGLIWPHCDGAKRSRRSHLTAFMSFPAEHWRHLRTTNPIESSFTTVKLRTRVAKGAGSKTAALAMAYKLLDAAQDRWHRFNGHQLLVDILDGVQFPNGIHALEDPGPETVTDGKITAHSS
jgi:putative transposase